MKVFLTILLLLLAVVSTPSFFSHARSPQQRRIFSDLLRKSSKSSSSSNTSSFPPLVNLVSTLIGSGGLGFGEGEMNPGAQVPFGLMRLGPDTSLGLEPLQLPPVHFGGYWYHDSHILGFSSLHLVGAGASDLCNFLTTAVRVDASVLSNHENAFPNAKLIQNGGYLSKFSHDEYEVGKPGYYSVKLQTPNVLAEVTVSGSHGGVQRYTCLSSPGEKTDPCAIVFDICHTADHGFFGPYNADCKSAQIYNWTMDPAKKTFSISATVTMAGGLSGRSRKNGGALLYFYAEASFENDEHATFSDRVFMWEDSKFSPSTSSSGSQSQPTTSHSLGMIVVANTSSSASSQTTFIVRSGVSYISAEYAKQNMYAEQQQAKNSTAQLISFDQAKTIATNSWQELLSRFQISAPTNSFNEPAGVFYSLVYRTHLAPSKFSEFDGSYLGMDYKLHNVKNENGGQQDAFYSDLSIWDIYRTQMPLLVFSAPDVSHDTVASMLSMQKQFQLPPYNQHCKLPQWILGNIEGDCMTGWHSSSIILSAISKNISWLANKNIAAAGYMVDMKYAFPIVSECILGEVSSSMPPPGFYAINSAGKTLEYGIDAGQVVYTAEHFAMNFTAANLLRPYATQGWRNIMHPEAKIPCPRKSGNVSDSSNFDCPTLFGKIVDWIPYPFEKRYIEESAVDARWDVVQDLEGLFDFLGNGNGNNKDVAASYLESFFFNSFNIWPNKKLNTTLEGSWFEVENEPTEHTPFLYCMMGPQYAHRTSYYVKKILDMFYYYGPGGSAGNDDFGGLDGGALFSYLGIFPIIPQTNYTVFTPVFDRATISPPGMLGLTLHITASGRNTSAETNYVKAVKINGRDIGSRAWFAHSELYQNMPSARTATIEFALSSVPVTIGNPNQAPWVPTTHDENNNHGAESLPANPDLFKKVMGMMMKKNTQRTSKRDVRQRFGFKK